MSSRGVDFKRWDKTSLIPKSPKFQWDVSRLSGCPVSRFQTNHFLEGANDFLEDKPMNYKHQETTWKSDGLQGLMRSTNEEAILKHWTKHENPVHNPSLHLTLRVSLCTSSVQVRLEVGQVSQELVAWWYLRNWSDCPCCCLLYHSPHSGRPGPASYELAREGERGGGAGGRGRVRHGFVLIQVINGFRGRSC